ncbi:MFS transporter [Kribbella sancticallisti]|uniref:MFS transporter n=1 Tax=Kribbella sancticallisti TaxID=460087 RepID=UPI0031E030C2
MAAFAASAAPIPLLNTYRGEEGFTNADISLTIVVYDLPTLAALLMMGRLSNHLGRRPTALASLGLLVLGCLLLLNVHDVSTLLAGRVLMGLGAGLASSNVTAYIVDAAPSRPTWLASAASSQTPMLGLALGAIGSGAATRGLLHGSTVADRAPIFSVIYLICYSAAAFPSLVSGQLSKTFSLPQIALGYGGLALVATLFTVLAVRDPDPQHIQEGPTL